MAVTPWVFCAVIEVIADAAYVPFADIAFKSALDSRSTTPESDSGNGENLFEHGLGEPRGTILKRSA